MGTNDTIIAMTAIVMGMLTLLIPITGLTARFALKPLMEALAKYRELQGQDQAQQLLERRMALLEEQLHGMDRSLRDLADESDFRRQLEGGRARQALPVSRIVAEPQPALAAEALLAER
ncbi:MAG: hypothetical protein AVDCRST_MAG89-2018 [uncultured Gemmatimonadetes bacterium]|uniref:Uncharacterized protein n=1 Tax=uncultured Gemmatimonadota bacterium TaxID=203437 RepID=A0A6J4LB92_9BACT|nr:MAG: hypothetical protein AVDCRST_MAG89-2018 [uncultured Gemmatimonadota bacterium]